MGCAFVYGKSIGKRLNHFNIAMAEIGAEARGMSVEKLYHKLPKLLEAKYHHNAVDFITELEASILLDFPIPFFYLEVKDDNHPTMMCGKCIIPCAFCGQASDFYCDAPIGDGRTCDLPLCVDHKHHRPDIGANIDYCPHHKSGATQ